MKPEDTTGAPLGKQVGAGGEKARTSLVTLLFTDIVGSTSLKQQLGDRAGDTLFQKHHQLVRQTLAQFLSGQEIETAGDSFLIIFSTPSDAVSFALLLQSRVRRLREAMGVALFDRVGVHVGEVVLRPDEGALKPRELYGIQIDTCSRVMSLAKAGQVLMSRGVFDSARQVLKGEDIEGVGPLEWLNHGAYLLKGLDEPAEICEVREAGQTEPPGPPTSSEKAQRQLRADEEQILGWRPAMGQPVPNTQWILEQKLGEGGFGEVWLGRHQTMKQRRVFKFCFRADRVRSLKREMTLFRLIQERIGEHPNIVALREVYFEQPPFYVEMDYVEGQDLKTWSQGQGGAEEVPLKVKLEIVAQIADALQAAHDAGVIHRDIKPANILISSGPSSHTLSHTSSPEIGHISGHRQSVGPCVGQSSEAPGVVAKLSDFGIGQVVSQDYLVGVTRAGFTMTMLGSGSSSQTGTQLYMAPELLAGNPATTRSDIYSLGVVLYQLLVGDFRRPLVSDWAKDISDPLLREDLAHCFMGNPEERFAGASQLARNLRAWPERKARLEREEAERAEQQRLKAQTERRRRVALGVGIVALVLVGLAIALGYGLRQAQRERERQRRMAYASDMKAAQVAVQQNNRGLALTLLERHVPAAGQEDLRGIEWQYLWRFAHGSEQHSFPHLSFVHDLAFSPDGRLLATVDWFQTIRFWEVASGQRVRELKGGNPGMSRCLGFANGGRRFVVRGGGGARVLDTSDWSVVTNFPCPGSALFVVSGNGKRLVTRGAGKMDAWDLDTWQHQELPGQGAACYSLAVNHAGTLVALSMGFEGFTADAFVWDLLSNSAQKLGDRRDVDSFAFSPDGQWLAAGRDSGGIELWDLKSRQCTLQWRAHPFGVYALAFSPDGSRLASGGSDRMVALWEAGTTNRVSTLTGHGGQIDCVAFSPDGRQLASASKDNTVKVWDLQPAQPVSHTNRLGLPPGTQALRASEDGTGLFTLGKQDDTLSLWSFQTGQSVWSFPGSTGQTVGCSNLVYFPKSNLALGFSSNRVLYFWELTSRKLVRSVPLPVASLKPASLSPDQRWLVARAVPEGLALFDLQSGTMARGWEPSQVSPWCADFSPDNRLLAYSVSNDIHIWDLMAARKRLACRGVERKMACFALRFSPDSKFLAGGDWVGGLYLWSVATGEFACPPLKGHDNVWICSFSRDGKTLITSDMVDFNTRFWNVASGQETLYFPKTFPLSIRQAVDFDITYRAAVDHNPAPNLLVWEALTEEVRGWTETPWQIHLPSLREADAAIQRDRRELADEDRDVKARQREEARLQAAIPSDPGAVKEWLVLGPIRLAPGQSELEALDSELVANESQLRPGAGDKVRIGGGELRWQAVRVPSYAVNFNSLFGQTDHAVAYAVSYPSLPAPQSGLKMWVSSDDQAKIYLNGKLLYRYAEPRTAFPDQDCISGIELQGGVNVLVFKVVNGTFNWGGSVRFTDLGGKPVAGIKVLTSPP